MSVPTALARPVFGLDLRVMLLCVGLAGSLPQPARAATEPPTTAPGTPGTTDITAPAAVQPLPPWVVLVLKPVSDNRVQPVTGVVISPLGMVLVPFDFAGPGDQLVVLDGGTDFVADGRAARVHRQFPAVGLSVLQVTDLQRPAAVFSNAWPGDGDSVQLAAFPPAEMIAQGAAPLWSEARLAVSGAGGDVAGSAAADYRLATDSHLPNVTGPLLDRCGHWFGFSAAEGIQSMDIERAPAYAFRPDLTAVMDQLNIALPQVPCDTPVAATADEAAAAPAVVDTELPSAAGEIASGVATLPALAGQSELAQPSLLRRFGWLLVGLVLLLLGAAVIRFRRPHGTAATGADQTPATMAQPATDAALADAATPEPAASHCLLEIHGRMPDGTAFTRSCQVNAAAIHVVIGRSSGDILIDSAEVHREHAVLSGSAEQLTVSDLGSTRGTWINRVPCLKGEIMFVGPDDTLFLGDVSFQLHVKLPEPGCDGNA